MAEIKPVIVFAPITPQASPQTLTEADAKAWIYQHESGNNSNAINPTSGACGLGQRLNCQLLIDECPDWKTNYACNDNHFTKYMLSRYGSWSKAYNFWQSNRWW